MHASGPPVSPTGSLALAAGKPGGGELVIVLPVHDDWEACALVLGKIAAVLDEMGRRAGILIIDDGSNRALPPDFPGPGAANSTFGAIDTVEVMRLRRNLGNQRAICVALAYLAAERPGVNALLMDSDGEDDPAEIPRLLGRFDAEGGRSLVFGERTKRSEGGLFRLGYLVYRALFRVLVGVRVRFGNFSVLGPAHVQTLSAVPDLWNHYAAAVVSSGLPFVTEPTSRAPRLAGDSQMNLVSLTVHGLSALAAFSDRIGVRALLVAFVGLCGLGLSIVAVISARLFTDAGIPGWATFTIAIIVLLGVQIVSLIFAFCFTILAGRNAGTFLPARDFRYFVGGITRTWQTPGTAQVSGGEAPAAGPDAGGATKRR